MIIALDFDGTVTTHNYPHIGTDIGAIPVLKKIIAAKHKLILYTMRHGPELENAVEYLKERGIEVWGINKNSQQWRWTKSPKIYAHHYIDDAAVGCPLINDASVSDRPYVDWVKMEQALIDLKII